MQFPVRAWKLCNAFYLLLIILFSLIVYFFFNVYFQKNDLFYIVVGVTCLFIAFGMIILWWMGFRRLYRIYQQQITHIENQNKHLEQLSQQLSAIDERNYTQIIWQNNWLFKFQQKQYQQDELAWLARCATQILPVPLATIMKINSQEEQLQAIEVYFAPTQMRYQGFTIEKSKYAALFDIVKNYTPLTLSLQPTNDWLYHFGIQCAIAYPIYCQHQFFGGIIAFHTESSYEFSSRQHALLEWIAQSVSMYLTEIEQRKTIHHLSIFQKEHSFFMSSSPIGIAHFKSDKPISIATLKYRPEKLLQIPLYEVNDVFLEYHRIEKTEKISISLDEIIARYVVIELIEKRQYTTEKILPDGKGDLRYLQRYILADASFDVVSSVWIIEVDITLLKSDNLFYRSLSEQSSAMQVVTDKNGIILFDNQRVSKTLGWQLEERKGKSLYSYMQKKDASTLQKLAFLTQHTETIQFFCGIHLTTRFGEDIETDGVISFHKHPHQEIKGLLFEFYPSKARAEQIQKLQQEADFYKHLVENQGIAITVLNREGIILYESESLQKLFGYSSEMRLGKHGFEYFDDEDTYLIHKNFQIACKTRQPVAFETRFRHYNGNWKKVEITFVNLLEQPSVQGILMIWQDISYTIRRLTSKENK